MDTGDLNVLSNLSAPVVNTIEQNIVLNAFRTAVNGSLTQFGMVDGIVDEYEDESGIDNPTSTNESYDSVNDLYSPNKPAISPSPFTHMKLENNTDVGSGANAVTDIGTPTYTAGKLNNALTLDGSTDALNLDALVTDVKTDTSGSVAFWFNADDIATGIIFSVGDTDVETFFVIGHDFTNNNIFATLQVSGTKWNMSTPSSSITGSTYHHVTLTHNGIEPSIYIDGVLQTLTYAQDVDRTLWFNGLPLIDNGRLGCRNSSSGGNSSFFDGQVDDFRYYQNTVLTQSEINAIHNSGIGSEATNPEGIPENMTLQSISFTAEAQADNSRIVIFEEDVDSITLNTDLKAFASRDGGTTFTQITLVNEGEYESGRNILAASVDISGQPAGTSMIYKIETANNKDLKMHGSSLNWD